MVHVIGEIFGKEGLCKLGFDIPRDKLTARQAIILNRVEEDLPSTSDIAKEDNIEHQEITENTARGRENLITQLQDKTHPPSDSFKHPLHEVLGLDKELKSIRGSLKGERAKKVQLEECIEKKKCKLMDIENSPEYDDGIQEDIRNRIGRLNDDLKVRQESINLLKGRLTNQNMGIKETIPKVLNKDTSLTKKIRTLFREKGITIASVLTAIGMAISVLVEALPLSGGDAVTQGKGGGHVESENMKEWLRNKLKALASLLGRLGVKVAEAFPGIIGAIINWILNREKKVVGWVLAMNTNSLSCCSLLRV